MLGIIENKMANIKKSFCYLDDLYGILCTVLVDSSQEGYCRIGKGVEKGNQMIKSDGGERLKLLDVCNLDKS